MIEGAVKASIGWSETTISMVKMFINELKYHE